MTICSWSASAVAQQVLIELPQQPLSKALSALARQSGTDIIAPIGLLGDRTAPALKGRMTAREALGQLLRGTALDVEQRDDKTYVVISPKSKVPQSDTSTGATAVLPPIVVTNRADSDAKGLVVHKTSSATRTDTPILEIPQSILAVNKEVIRRQQDRSIGEVLHNISGVQLENGSAGNRHVEPEVNGFLANVTLNNGLVNVRAVQRALTLPMVAISRVEVLKGADAIVSGRGEAGGTINVVTKVPESTPFHEFVLQTGSYTHSLGSVDVTGPVTSDKRLSYRFLLSGERTGRLFGSLENKRDFYISPALRWKDDGTGTDCILIFDQHSMHSPFKTYGVILDDANIHQLAHNQQSYTTDNNTGVSYNLEQKIGPHLTFYSLARYEEASHGETAATVFSEFAKKGTRYKWTSNLAEHSYYLTFDNHLNSRVMSGPVHHNLVTGYAYSLYSAAASDYSYGFFRASPKTIDVNHHAPNPSYSFQTPAGKDYYGSLYLLDNISWKRLHLLLSVAHGQSWIQHRFSQGHWNPNFGLAYQLSDIWTVFANQHRGFQPNGGLRLLNGLPAPSTKKRSVEAGVKFQFLDDRLVGTVAFHRSHSRNDVRFPLENDGRFVVIVPRGRGSRGVAVDLYGKIFPGLNLISNYSYDTYMENEFDESQGSFFSCPKHAGNLWVSYDFQNPSLHGWGFSAGLRIRGSYPAKTYNFQTIRISVPGQASISGNIYYHGKHWSGTLGLKNILNRRLYSDGGGGQFVGLEPGRTFYMTGSFNF
ncbi:MAG: Vitamin B12 transporter BtuB [Burkholderia gladioli]|nr:MAG: Vitamin B12 transporter BtuB [Burkholderia gladioli]